MTQSDLADRCGLSDRTIRGLENGAIRTPQPATLRLLAEALGLGPRERAAFGDAWGAPRSPVWLDALPTLDELSTVEWGRRLRDQSENIREVSSWSRRTFDRNRNAHTLAMRRGFVVERGEVRSWLTGVSRVVSREMPVVRHTENCRFVEGYEYGPDLWLLEFAFDQVLRAGDAYTFAWEVAPDPATPLARTNDVLVGVADTPSCLSVEVHFDVDAVPVRLWQVSKPAPDAELTMIRPVNLSPYGTAHVVLQHPKPGFHGLTWEWPEQPHAPTTAPDSS